MRDRTDWAAAAPPRTAAWAAPKACADRLVIDSVGFKSEKIWIDENANPQSEQMHAIERWTRPDADHIDLELTVDDPKYYTRPFNFSRTHNCPAPEFYDSPSR